MKKKTKNSQCEEGLAVMGKIVQGKTEQKCIQLRKSVLIDFGHINPPRSI